jgi:hypothetical protein
LATFPEHSGIDAYVRHSSSGASGRARAES